MIVSDNLSLRVNLSFNNTNLSQIKNLIEAIKTDCSVSHLFQYLLSFNQILSFDKNYLTTINHRKQNITLVPGW